MAAVRNGWFTSTPAVPFAKKQVIPCQRGGNGSIERRAEKSRDFGLSAQAANSASKAFALVKSGASKPSVNEP